MARFVRRVRSVSAPLERAASHRDSVKRSEEREVEEEEEEKEAHPNRVLASFDGMGIRSLFSVAICAVYFDNPWRSPSK